MLVYVLNIVGVGVTVFVGVIVGVGVLVGVTVFVGVGVGVSLPVGVGVLVGVTVGVGVLVGVSVTVGVTLGSLALYPSVLPKSAATSSVDISPVSTPAAVLRDTSCTPTNLRLVPYVTPSRRIYGF